MVKNRKFLLLSVLSLSKKWDDNLSEEERAEIIKHLEPWRQKLLEIMDKVEKEKREKEEADGRKKTHKASPRV
jgi:TRAP-type C4-dicarboxylate transport system substrate-binding protein